MIVDLQTMSEHLKCGASELATLLRKLGYRKNKTARWKIDEVMAQKLIKTFRLWRNTKPSKRKFIDFKALRLSKESVVHKKPTFTFVKKRELNQVL